MTKLVVAAVASLATLGLPGVAAAEPRANGGGSNGAEDFAFGAKLTPHGPEGSIMFKVDNADAPDTIVHGRVGCIRVVGNEAFLSGMVSNTNHPNVNFEQPHPHWYAHVEDVADPGQGEDRFTALILPTPFPTGMTACNLELAVGLPLTHGNVQVNGGA